MSLERELETFLLLISDELSRGRSPEYSFQAARFKYTGPLHDELRGAYLELINGKSFGYVCDRLGARLGSRECSLMLNITKRFVSRGAREAGRRLTYFISMLKENRWLVEERDRIMKSFAFRVRVITLTCAAASAFLASLSPFIISLLTFKTPSKYHVTLPVTIFLHLTSVIASHYAACAVLMKRAYLNTLISSVVFIVVSVASSALFWIL